MRGREWRRALALPPKILGKERRERKRRVMRLQILLVSYIVARRQTAPRPTHTQPRPEVLCHHLTISASERAPF